jgi:cell division protein FtsL
MYDYNKGIVTILFICIITLYATQTVLHNRYVLRGIELSVIQDKIETMQKMNNRMKVNLLKSLSLIRIATIASEQGFVQSNKYVYIKE